MATQSAKTDHGIRIVDAMFSRPEQTASFLLVDTGKAAIIETGTARSAPFILGALSANGLRPSDVEYVIVTHVHLDHAGGAGALMEQLPHAKLFVHPRGAKHLVDPTKLVAGASAVYGEEEVKQLFGDIVPVPANRIIEAADGFELTLNGRRLRFFDTPGHARHHFCVHDESTGSVFAGDAFGLSYRQLDSSYGTFTFPTTSPARFEPEAMTASIQKLASLKPQAMYLTHFGRIDQVEQTAHDLCSLVEQYVEMAERAATHPDRHQILVDEMTKLLLDQIRAHGCELSTSEIQDVISMDVGLNVQGLLVWLDQQRSAKTTIGAA